MVLFCHVTTRVDGQKYDNLLSQKKGTAFPYLTVLDAKGNLLTSHQGARSLAAFKSTLEKGQSLYSRLSDLEKKAQAGDQEAAQALCLEKLEKGFYTLDEAKAAVAAAGFTGDDQAKAAGMLTDLEIQLVIDETNPRDLKSRIAAGAKFVGILKDGRKPYSDATFENFWVLVMDHAESVKDVKNFKAGYDALYSKYGDAPQAKRFFDGKQKILDAMTGAAPKQGDDGEDEDDDSEDDEGR